MDQDLGLVHLQPCIWELEKPDRIYMEKRKNLLNIQESLDQNRNLQGSIANHCGMKCNEKANFKTIILLGFTEIGALLQA